MTQNRKNQYKFNPFLNLCSKVITFGKKLWSFLLIISLLFSNLVIFKNPIVGLIIKFLIIILLFYTGILIIKIKSNIILKILYNIIFLLSIYLIIIYANKDIQRIRGLRFTPAHINEILIIVSQFNQKGSDWINTTTRIVDQLKIDIEKLNIKDIRIEESDIILNEKEAYKVGKKHNALAIIWGWYDNISFNAKFNITQNESLLTSHYIAPIPTEISSFKKNIREEFPIIMSQFVILTIGQMYILKGKYNNALILFNTILMNYTPDYVPPSLQYPEYIKNLFFYRGYTFFKMDSIIQAINDFTLSIKLDTLDNYNVYNNRGIAFKQTGNYKEAINDFTSAIKLDSKEPIYYYNRGNTYLINGNVDDAIIDYKIAINICPQYGNVYYHLSKAYLGKNENDSAILYINKAIKILPKDADCYYSRGNIYLNIKDYKNAINNYTISIKYNPKMDIAYNNRGFAYKEINDDSDSKKDFINALKINPNNKFANYNLGSTYASENNYDKALYYFTKVIFIDSTDSIVYRDRGYIYLMKNLKAEAKSDFKKYLLLYPNADDSLEVRNLINSLENK